MLFSIQLKLIFAYNLASNWCDFVNVYKPLLNTRRIISINGKFKQKEELRTNFKLRRCCLCDLIKILVERRLAFLLGNAQ